MIFRGAVEVAARSVVGAGAGRLARGRVGVDGHHVGARCAILSLGELQDARTAETFEDRGACARATV